MNYEAITTSWKTKISDKTRKNSTNTRFSELPETGLDSEQLQDFFEKLKPEIEENTNSVLSKYENIPQEAAEFGNNLVFKAFELFLTKSSKVGIKEALANLMGIDSSNNKIQRSSFGKLLDDFNFRNTVETSLRENFEEFDESDIYYLKNKICLKDCPGIWLKTQIDNQLVKANQSDASNELDITHLAHLPYVHLLFTDKRIVEMTKQVFRFNNLPKLLRKINLPVSIKDSIESLENKLF